MPGNVSGFPAAIAAMLQQNYLQRALQEYLYPNLRYLNVAQHMPVPNHIGDTITMTRPGLLAARPDPVDPTAATGLDQGMTPQQWALEQYTLTLQLFDGAQDIDLLTKEQSIVDRFAHSVRTNVVQSAQSLDLYCRNVLFGGLVPSGNAPTSNIKEGYLSGNTVVTSASSGTTLTVDDITGFTTALVNGVVTAVSGSNKIAIYKNGVAAGVNVTGFAVSGTSGIVYGGPTGMVGGKGVAGTLTIDGSLSVSVGDVITAADAPAIFRPNGKTHSSKLAATDTLGQASILDAVAYLRNAQVPTLDDGTYLLIGDYVSMRQLFGDNDFKIAGQGLMQSGIFRNAEVSRYLGVTIVQSSNAPVQPASSATGASPVTVRRPIICGKDALVFGHFEGISDFGGLGRSAGAAMANGAQMSFIETTPNGIAYVLRPPLDRLGRSMSIAWQAVADAIAPTDLTASSQIIITGNNARRKRAAVIEHAG